MIIYRKMVEEDKQEVLEMMLDRGFPNNVQTILPQCGFVAVKEQTNQIIACCFNYFSTCGKLAYIAWQTVRKGTFFKNVPDILKSLIILATSFAEDLGYAPIITVVPKMGKVFQEIGYKITEDNRQLLIHTRR